MPSFAPQSPLVTPDSPSKPVTLASVKAQLTRWRTTRVKGTRMPHTLWEGIRALSFSYDYNTLASALALDPRRLRIKMDEWKIPDSPLIHALPITPAKVQDFVELPLRFAAELSQSSEQKGDPYCNCTIELTRPDGTTLKVNGLAHQDLLSLTQGFLKP